MEFLEFLPLILILIGVISSIKKSDKFNKGKIKQKDYPKEKTELFNEKKQTESSLNSVKSAENADKHIHAERATVGGKLVNVIQERIERTGSLGDDITEGCVEHYDTRFITSDIVTDDDETDFYELQKAIVLGDVLNNPKFKRNRKMR